MTLTIFEGTWTYLGSLQKWKLAEPTINTCGDVKNGRETRCALVVYGFKNVTFLFYFFFTLSFCRFLIDLLSFSGLSSLWYAGRCNMRACRTLRVASVFTQTQLTLMVLQFILVFQGSLHFSGTTKIQNTCNYGHIWHICAALCILCSACNHTWRLGVPVSQLHCRTSCCMS